MVLRQLVTVGALGAALLDQVTNVKACSCEGFKSVCDYAKESTVVAHVRVLSSTRDMEANINDFVTFTVEIQTLFKGVTADPELLTFSTCGNSACCGIDLTIDQEYLIGLYSDGIGGDGLYAGSCGLRRQLTTETTEDLDELFEDCENDPCNGACDGYEECVMYPGEGYTCAYQSCDPSPCAEDETCIIQESSPPIVTCSPRDECDLECLEFQDCLIYTGGGSGADEPFCADVCAPGRCGDEEACTLEEVQCVRAPCPPVAVCTAAPLPTPPPPMIAGYEGCFEDTRDDRVLGHQYDSPSMNTEMCVAHCHDEGAAYAATQYGYECWCYVTGRADFDRHGTEKDEDGVVCETPCAGDKDEKCGGTWAFSLYKLPWPKAPNTNEEFVGCYRDTRDERVMTHMVTLAHMAPEICRKHCSDKDALYYATQYGSECWCGSSNKISDYNKHGEGVCHLPCSGDEEFACGGFYAFDLFKYTHDI